MIKIIVAHDSNRGIGYCGRIPWTIPGELRWLSNITRFTRNPKKKNALVMGRITYESIPPERRPLRERINIVISSHNIDEQGVLVFRSFHDAIRFIRGSDAIEDCFIFGGETIYRTALAADVVEEVYISVIEHSFPADTHFPELPAHFAKMTDDTVAYGSTIVRHELYAKTDTAINAAEGVKLSQPGEPMS